MHGAGSIAVPPKSHPKQTPDQQRQDNEINTGEGGRGKMKIEGVVEGKKIQRKEARKSEIKAKGRGQIRQGNRKYEDNTQMTTES